MARKMPYDRFVYFKMTSASRSACLKKFAALVMIAKAPCISGRITAMKARCCDGLLLAQVLKYAPAGADQGIIATGSPWLGRSSLAIRSCRRAAPILFILIWAIRHAVIFRPLADRPLTARGDDALVVAISAIHTERN